MSFFIGIVLALLVAIFAKATRFDHDRSFYPTVLIVIASYYVLFAFMHGEGVLTEVIVASIFLLAAVVGIFYLPIVTGLGIIVHGSFDLLYPVIINNPGVPLWWPAFCAGVDIALGAWVIWLTLKGPQNLGKKSMKGQP